MDQGPFDSILGVPFVSSVVSILDDEVHDQVWVHDVVGVTAAGVVDGDTGCA